jgi:hypothetical protein
MSANGTTTDKLIRHAERYGTEGVYDVATRELDADQLRGLATRLKTIAKGRGERLRLPTSRNGLDMPDLASRGHKGRGVIRNEMSRQGDSSSEAPGGAERPICSVCSNPLPSTLRADARFCGGACKQAAHRRKGASVKHSIHKPGNDRAPTTWER